MINLNRLNKHELLFFKTVHGNERKKKLKIDPELRFSFSCETN